MMIGGLECEDIPDSYIPLEAAVVFKCLNAKGQEELVTRATDGLALWDEAAVFMAAFDAARTDLASCWGDDE
jgi:hypothetical protein